VTPLEPLYTLRVAAEMIPCVHVGALKDFLRRHRREFPTRTMPINRRRVRMLYLSEIERIRQLRVKEESARTPRTRLRAAP
jgi:hypothetical protein